MDYIFSNVLGWPCILCWLTMWVIIIGVGGTNIRKTLFQPSSLIIFSISAFTILPGYVLANTSARLFRFDASPEDFQQIGNLYGMAFLIYGISHIIFKVKPMRKIPILEEFVKNDRTYLIMTSLVASVIVTCYYVHQVGFLALQMRDSSGVQEISNQGAFALFRLIPYSCLSVLSFARVKKLSCPTWLYIFALIVCLAYGVVFVERLLFVFTILIASYFSIIGAKKAVILKATLALIMFIALFSLISYYRFLHDKDYNLGNSKRFTGHSLSEQVGINLIFFDNITPIADAYASLSVKGQFWGVNSYLVSALQFVPQILWSDKSTYIDNERVVKKLGVTTGSPGNSVTPSPWGEFLVCFGGNYFVVFATFFAMCCRYLDKLSYRIQNQSYSRQFAFFCLVLNLMFNARNPVSAFFLFSVLFWVPAHLLFHFSYDFHNPKKSKSHFLFSPKNDALTILKN